MGIDIAVGLHWLSIVINFTIIEGHFNLIYPGSLKTNKNPIDPTPPSINMQKNNKTYVVKKFA